MTQDHSIFGYVLVFLPHSPPALLRILTVKGVFVKNECVLALCASTHSFFYFSPHQVVGGKGQGFVVS